MRCATRTQQCGCPIPILVAVKPQQFAALARSVTAPLEGKFVVTVMAGVTLAAVAQALGATAAVRCMPKLGAQIGARRDSLA